MAFFLIKDDILRKEDVREQLFNYGLITLVPTGLKSLGMPSEYLMKGMVVVVDLQESTLRVGDVLVAKKNSHYTKHVIESLQVDDSDVQDACGGVVGVKVGSKIPTKSEIFVYKER
ncbi:hypothetical protein D3C71_1931250 [compost metagenome]